MNILFVSAEAVPFAKVGGMADVIGSLPSALRKHGIDARVIIPGYGLIEHHRYQISHLFSFDLTLHEGTAEVQVFTAVHQGVPFYFVQSWPFFGDEKAVYTGWDWDVPRFIAFNQLVMGVMWQLQERLGWFPDVCHVNDWHTGLLPFLIKQAAEDDPAWGKVRTLLSIHNLAYQGDRVGGYLWKAGIPARNHPELVSRGLTDNTMAIAIAYSDAVTTVSPRYATEIQYAYMGVGLDDLIRTRADDLTGILNGIDDRMWDPATDPHIHANFDSDTVLQNRQLNKRYLQRQAGLAERDDVMLIGMVSRLAWQKGFDMAIPALRHFLAGYDVQFVLLGSGDQSIEHEMWRIGKDFFWKARTYLQFDAAVAQHIYAGSDVFLMPSHFEPCGMGQMIAMRYGSLPIVRETGGLADTVENYDDAEADRGTGFVFLWEEADAVLGTLRWAQHTFQHRQHAWQRMQQRAMSRDFSWSKSAMEYIRLYKNLAK
ncbi:MAG: glycogen synthase [Chloroflexota bacterium]